MRIKTLIACGFIFGSSLFGQPVNVQKAQTTNALTGDIVVPTGRTISASGSGSIAATGGTAPVFISQITTPKIVYTGTVIEVYGSGTPESSVTANIGSLYHRTDGSTGTTLYVKESGTGNTGWAAVGGGGGGSIGGSTGSTDNALIRADGTGGATVQSSNVTLADSGTAFAFSGAGGITAGSGDIGLTPGSGGRVVISQNASASVGPVISNTSAGSGAGSEIQFTNGAGSTYISLGGTGNAGGTYFTNWMYFYAPSSAAGMSFHADSAVKMALDSTGGHFLDNLSVTKTAVDMGIYISGSASHNRSLYYQTGANVRWALYEDAASEAGSNAGTNFWLTGFNDGGTGLADVFLAYRKTGDIIFGTDYGNYPSDSGAPVQVLGPTDTKSSGTALGLTVTRTYNQTSTAGSVDVLVNRTETAIGSGTHLFADFQVAAASKFSVSRTGAVSLSGSITTQVAGATLAVKSGSNAKAGTFTLTAGSATVSNTSITANSVVVCALKTSSGTPGLFDPLIVLNAGTGFTATGAATDNSTYNFVVLEVN